MLSGVEWYGRRKGKLQLVNPIGIGNLSEDLKVKSVRMMGINGDFVLRMESRL